MLNDFLVLDLSTLLAGPFCTMVLGEMGAEVIKIFPGQEVGGPKFVSAIQGPCPWTNIMPTGGVEPTEENLSAWFKAGAYCVGMGSKLITKEIIKEKDFKKLEEKVNQTIRIIKSIK